MELVLKLPKGKPPFIGVLFNFQMDAANKNKSWISNTPSQKFDLIIEPSQKLYITISTGSHRSERYEVDYDPVNLLKFLHYTKDCQAFNFGHLFMHNGKYEISKAEAWGSTFSFLFKIHKIQIPLLVVEK